jgi:RNA-directed DNA polymerase
LILEPPASVQKLRTALQVKAKEKPDYRFYLLYDKVYRKDVLAYAYQRCKANNGAPGTDGQDFADVEAYGEERWLDELADTHMIHILVEVATTSYCGRIQRNKFLY